MKRFNYLLGLAFLLVIVGCSSGEETGGTADGEVSGEITVWVHPFTDGSDEESDMWDEVVTSFEEEKGVDVNLEQIPWSNRDQKILTALAANNGPDVFYAIPDQMPQYADEGMLLELDPYLEDMDMDDFVDTSLVSTTWQDKTYGLPILQEAYTLFYNKDIVKAIGEDPESLPTTWDEFEEWSKKAKDEGYYAMSYPGGGSMNGTIYPWIWQAGGDIITQDDEVLINSQESVKAFEFINSMYEDGRIPEDSITAKEHNALWDNGEIMATLGSGITLSNLLSKDVVDFAIGEPLKNEEKVTYGTTGMFVVPSNSDNKTAAAEFVKTMTNTENQRKFNKVTQYIPTRKSAQDIFDDQEYIGQLAEYTQYALPGVIHPIGRDIMPAIQAEVQTMMEGKKTPQEAADAAAEAIEADLNN
ncbi:sugar ABC transporter substrate-binding protein [Thalassobacillus sp. CUG 92003]|uniref:sugar ABC transporter substrate-binding protein n=1 Tax=Thalassobacillus sp. CUG 92003 TaxID=2736641 RepID=UPI0015E63E05|nr:sugar ABC transporter substrate-binding protein [Thalassobacillus sp. CUG 92003]